MNLSGIISIAGVNGLHKIVARSKNGIIVENVVDKKRTAVQSTEKVSALEDISMFTTEEDILLLEVFKNIYAATGAKNTTITHKSEERELRAYFKEVLPSYDEDRVYTSNIKKVIEWYNLLLNANLLVEEEKVEESDEDKKLDVKSIKTENKLAKNTSIKSNTPKVNSKASGGVKVTTRKSGIA